MMAWILKAFNISLEQWRNVTDETRKSMVHAYLTQGIK